MKHKPKQKEAAVNWNDPVEPEESPLVEEVKPGEPAAASGEKWEVVMAPKLIKSYTSDSADHWEAELKCGDKRKTITGPSYDDVRRKQRELQEGTYDAKG